MVFREVRSTCRGVVAVCRGVRFEQELLTVRLCEGVLCSYSDKELL